jgi:hypothetical protein
MVVPFTARTKRPISCLSVAGSRLALPNPTLKPTYLVRSVGGLALSLASFQNIGAQ